MYIFFFFFSGVSRTCVNMAAAALRPGPPSPVTVQEQDTQERHVTTVSLLIVISAPCPSPKLPISRRSLPAPCAPSFISGLLICVIWLCAHIPSRIAGVGGNNLSFFKLRQPEMTLKSPLLFLFSFLFSSLWTSVSLKRLYMLGIFHHRFQMWHPPPSWILAAEKPMLKQYVWNPFAPEYWWLVYMQANACNIFFSFLVHVRGNMTERASAELKIGPLLPLTQLSSASPKNTFSEAQLRLQYLKPGHLEALRNWQSLLLVKGDRVWTSL